MGSGDCGALGDGEAGCGSGSGSGVSKSICSIGRGGEGARTGERGSGSPVPVIPSATAHRPLAINPITLVYQPNKTSFNRLSNFSPFSSSS